MRSSAQNLQSAANHQQACHGPPPTNRCSHGWMQRPTAILRRIVMAEHASPPTTAIIQQVQAPRRRHTDRPSFLRTGLTNATNPICQLTTAVATTRGEARLPSPWKTTQEKSQSGAAPAGRDAYRSVTMCSFLEVYRTLERSSCGIAAWTRLM